MPFKPRTLEDELKNRVRGEVRFDAGSRALYATDGSNYRQPPIGVVIPRDRQDVIETVAVCRKHEAPILGRGCGTSLAGQTCNTAVVIDMSKYMNSILHIDPENKLARVEPGVILDNLRAAANEYRLTFAPDPATHTHNTLGGMIGNNSCGVHSVMGGRTIDNIHELEILTYDGEVFRVGATSETQWREITAGNDRRADIYRRLHDLQAQHADEIRRRFPDIPRRVSGYSLDELLPEREFNVARALVGSESTCALVLEATVNLVYNPPKRALLLLGYPDVYQAADHIPEVMSFPVTGCEGIDDRLIDDMTSAGLHPENSKLLPEGKGWLLVEIGAESDEELHKHGHAMMDRLKRSERPPAMCFYTEPHEQEKVWRIRESGLAATAHVPGEPIAWPGWEDSAVPPEKLGDYLRELRALFERYDYHCDMYGHFGQGCLHTRIDFDLESLDGIARYRAFIQDAARLVASYGGSFSGEHGDGQARGELLPLMYGETLMRAFREFKAIWDPLNKMNPGKVLDASATANLRVGVAFRERQVETNFHYPKDEDNFAKVALRCVGIGKCRRENGGTMCPSFMATREEKHCTRGRARLLFEMLKGDVITGGWQEEAVKDSLDLCLSCKGCKSDCPVNVDMATYKAEFLSHYFAKNKRRPRAAHTMGRIDRWARLGTRMPGIVNFLTGSRGLAGLSRFIAGVAPQRSMPRFAGQNFQAWFHQRPAVNAGAGRVLLWPDTFNNYFYPEAARAAAEVLESAGFQVLVPRRHLCCGRPLYEWGLVPQATRYLQRVLHSLADEIDAGIPVVGLEPACVSVFRDEMAALLPDDPAANRLRGQCYLLSEFLMEKAPEFARATQAQLPRKALVHLHCHHKSVLGASAEEQLFEKLGLDFQVLDSGCCGMAGSFGMEREEEKYKVSVRCAERVLLPAIRAADENTLIIAGGFSCREQIRDLAGIRALHPGEVLRMAVPSR